MQSYHYEYNIITFTPSPTLKKLQNLYNSFHSSLSAAHKASLALFESQLKELETQLEILKPFSRQLANLESAESSAHLDKTYTAHKNKVLSHT